MNILIYPCKTLNISQNYNDSYSHRLHSKGKPADYPIDECGTDSGRDWFYCPCDEMKIVDIRYVGNPKYANQVWLQSTSKVEMPCGTDYVTIMVAHMEDADLKRLKNGQKFKRGDAIFQEGKNGNATGNHFHITVARGKTTKYVKNNLGAWCITPNSIKPEQAFFIDEDFTKIKNLGGIEFVSKPVLATTYKVGDKVRFSTCYKSAYSIIGFPPAGEALAPKKGYDKGTITKIYYGTNNPYLINDGQCFVNDGDIRELL